jgi:hypothetical protein
MSGMAGRERPTMTPPVLERSQREQALELAVEVTLIRETAALCDFG